jgi:uncharacterized protein involved in outer membrane biogenesis
MTARRTGIIVAIVVLVPIVLVGALLVVVQSAWAERWVEARASGALHRQVELSDIRLHLGWPPSITFGRLRISNPSWAATRELVDAQGLSAQVMVPPLFVGKVVIPWLEARQAVAGLEMQGDQATWRFGPQSNQPSRLVLGRVNLGDGQVRFIDRGDQTDLTVQARGTVGAGGELNASAKGTFRGEAMTADARVPHLDPQHGEQIDFAGNAAVGKTHASADGSFRYDGSQMDFKLKLAGDTAKHLSKLVRVVLPDTPPYNVSGHLVHSSNDWTFDAFQGRVGNSDLRGSLTYRTGGKRPFMRGDLHSTLLDLADLGPVIGAPPGTRPGKVANAQQLEHSAQREAENRLLPDEKLNVERWGLMDADVRLESKRINRANAIPIDSFTTHLTMQDSVLKLSPLTFGIAGGHVKSDVEIDGNAKPVRGRIDTDVQGLQLNQLVPVSGSMKDALGTLYGRAKLEGTGQSVADLLGTSDGRMTIAVDGGRVSELLVYLLNLDIPEVLRLLGTKNQQVELRCAVSGVAVKGGVATPDAFVVDTTESQVNVSGEVSLRDETLGLTVHPLPKKPSLFSLRTPIDLEGPMRHPKVHLHPGPIAARVAGAGLLAAVNPALAILPFIDTAPGKDTDCGALLAEAHAQGAEKKTS